MGGGNASLRGVADRHGPQLQDEIERDVHGRHRGRTKVDSRAVDRPHFFKIILSSSLRDGKLEIPTRFVRLFGKSLSYGIVALKVADGKVWHVGLLRSQGEVSLECGWREVVDYYRFENGHFLLFRLERDCNFHLYIFDRTTTEVEYPSTIAPCYGQRASGPPPMTEIGQDASVEILDPCMLEIVELESDDSGSVGTHDVSPTVQNLRKNRRLSSHQPMKNRNDSVSGRTRSQTSIVRAAEVKFVKPETGSSFCSGTSGGKGKGKVIYLAVKASRH